LKTVEEKMRLGVWYPQQRKRLSLTAGDPIEHVVRNDVGPATFFPINVKNLHRSRLAVNCTAYLEKIVDVSTSDPLFTTIVEMKWGATTLPTIMIAPGGCRQIDAFFVRESCPQQLLFNAWWTDFSGAVPKLRGPGDFKLTYAVSSANFPLVQQSFVVHLSNTLSEITFKACSPTCQLNHGFASL